MLNKFISQFNKVKEVKKDIVEDIVLTNILEMNKHSNYANDTLMTLEFKKQLKNLNNNVKTINTLNCDFEYTFTKQHSNDRLDIFYKYDNIQTRKNNIFMVKKAFLNFFKPLSNLDIKDKLDKQVIEKEQEIKDKVYDFCINTVKPMDCKDIENNPLGLERNEIIKNLPVLQKQDVNFHLPEIFKEDIKTKNKLVSIDFSQVGFGFIYNLLELEIIEEVSLFYNFTDDLSERGTKINTELTQKNRKLKADSYYNNEVIESALNALYSDNFTDIFCNISLIIKHKENLTDYEKVVLKQFIKDNGINTYENIPLSHQPISSLDYYFLINPKTYVID